MNILRIFSIGADKILAKNHWVKGRITGVQNSCLYVVKKPIRLSVNESNTLFSHYITFEYTVDAVAYQGKLFVSLHYRCPQKGDVIDIYYDPDQPAQYACYAFGPASKPIGW